MKLHRSSLEGNLVTGVGDGWLRIGTVVHRESVIVTAGSTLPGWAPQGWEGLAPGDFSPLAALHPDVVLFGSGMTLRFPHPRLFRALTDAGIGVETMDTPAACRTFNILAAEGRTVAAALLVESSDRSHRAEVAPRDPSSATRGQTQP